MKHIRGLFTTLLFLMLQTVGVSSGDASTEGQMTWGLHFSPTPGGSTRASSPELSRRTTPSTRCTTP